MIADALSYTVKCTYVMVADFTTECYKSHEFAFKYIEEGKLGEELNENSDGNDSESDDDIDSDNYMNTINNHIACYQDDIISVM